MTEKRTEGAQLIVDARNGCGPLIGLTTQGVADLVATYAPYGREAREKYFRYLREYSDEHIPCEYD